VEGTARIDSEALTLRIVWVTASWSAVKDKGVVLGMKFLRLEPDVSSFLSQLSGVRQRLSIASFDGISRPVEWAIREERLPRGLFKKNLIFSEEAIDLISFFKRDEEDFSIPGSPSRQ
jgi:hypothetical protein